MTVFRRTSMSLFFSKYELRKEKGGHLFLARTEESDEV